MAFAQRASAARAMEKRQPVTAFASGCRGTENSAHNFSLLNFINDQALTEKASLFAFLFFPIVAFFARPRLAKKAPLVAHAGRLREPPGAERALSPGCRESARRTMPDYGNEFRYGATVFTKL